MVPVLLAVKREVAASISAGRQTDVLQCVIYFYGRDKTTTGQTSAAAQDNRVFDTGYHISG